MRVVTVLVCVLVAAPGPAARAEQTEDEPIQEAIVRDYLKAYGHKEEVYFVRVNRRDDPSDALLARLADLKVRIRKRSRAIVRTDVPDAVSQAVFDRRTNEPGTLIKLGPIGRRERPIANVRLTRYQGTLNASYYEYTLRKRDGRWAVSKRKHVAES